MASRRRAVVLAHVRRVAAALVLSTAIARPAAAADGDLALRLVLAPSDAERERLLSEAGAAPSAEIVLAVVEQAREARLQARVPEPVGALEHARALALRVGDDLAFAAAANELGTVHQSAGRLAEAREAHQQALAVCGEDARCAVAAHTGLARASRGNDAERMAAAERAKAAADASGDPALLAETADELGLAFETRGDYVRAEALLEEGRAAAERSNDAFRLALADAHLGRFHRLRRETGPALQELARAHAAFAQRGYRALAGQAANNIGICHTMRGNFTAGMYWVQQGLDVAQALGNRVETANGLNNIGIIHRRQRDTDLALDYFNRALAIREELGLSADVAGSLNNISNVQRDRGDHRAAVATAQRSLALAEEAGNQGELSNILDNIGLTYRDLGEYGPAVQAYERSLALRRRMGDRGGEAGTLRGLAQVLVARGEYTSAQEMAERALALARETGQRELVMLSLRTAALALKGRGELEAARSRLAEALEVLEAVRADVVGGTEVQQRFFEDAVATYVSMVDVQIALADPVAALEFAERAKGRVLWDLLRGSGAAVARGMTADERAQEAELRKKIAELSAQATRAARVESGGPAAERLRAELAVARRAGEDFETRLFAARPELKVNRGRAPDFAAAELGALIPDAATALVEYVVAEGAAYVLVATRGSGSAPVVKAYDLGIDRAQVRAMVRDLRERIERRDLGVRRTARDVHQRLLGPAREQLRGRSRIVFVPDDALWDLPFQALVTRSGRYLIEECALSSVPSLTVLREVRARHRAPGAAAGGALLALGNPELGGGALPPEVTALRSAELVALPEAEREVRTLGRLYGAASSTVLVGAEAREDVLKSVAGRFRVVHLATHGVLDAAAPLRSHVLLTPGTADEDGMLEAEEIMALSLQADLVVLSACESGRGRIAGGEGLIGLSWALFVAGTPTSVVSQWKVDSASTSAFMVALHRRLRGPSPGTKADALRAASRALLANPAYRHPFYWAGFVMMGDAS
jgi:CHAT domain-containing protein/tetratricopeptide (TPR) repeat protein